MWKPGTAKPSSIGTDSLTPSSKAPSNGSAKKGLSGATLGMRFMQKRNQQQSPATPRRLETERQDVTMQVAVDEKGSNTVAALETTSSDMYGIQSELIGRRSFGGFKPKVNNNWQDCRRYIVGEDSEGRKEKHVSDEELLQRYQELLKGRSDHDKTSRTKKRKKSSGAPSSLNKKAKP